MPLAAALAVVAVTAWLGWLRTTARKTRNDKETT